MTRTTTDGRPKMVRGEPGLDVLVEWWRQGTVKGAAESLGIAEQSAKNILHRLRRDARVSSNDELLKFYSRSITSRYTRLLVKGETRKFRYYVDEDYRNRMRRQAREAMRRKRSKEGTAVRTHYKRLLEIQGDRCAICGGAQTLLNAQGQPRRLGVDHDHETGTIRGLLCNGCNYMIGCAHDDPAILEAGAAYLRAHADVTSHNYSGPDVERDRHAA